MDIKNKSTGKEGMIGVIYAYRANLTNNFYLNRARFSVYRFPMGRPFY